MIRVSHTPALSRGHLKRVLDAARAARPLPATPLKAFFSVRQHAPDASFIAPDAATDVALLEWLTAQVTDGLNRQRQHYHLTPSEIGAPLADALDQMAQDFRWGAVELEAWSVLFYRYVRVDLNLSWEQIEEITAQDRRTLRRRQVRGLHRLTHQIIRIEQEARHAAHRDWLHLAIPPVSGDELVGRAAILEHAWSFLTGDAIRRHLVLTGPGGVGKTALAYTLAHQLIDAVELDSAIHLHLSAETKPADVRLRCLEALSVPLSGEETLRACCQAKEVLIVLDDAEPLVGESETFREFLDQIAGARLILTSQRLPQGPALQVIHVPELDESDAMQVVVRAWPQSRQLDESRRRWIWEQAGGNPLALIVCTRLAAWLPRLSAMVTAWPDQAEWLTGLYRKAWQQIDENARYFWLATWLLPPPHIRHDLARHASGLDERQALRAAQQLEQWSLLSLDAEEERHVLHSVARAYLHHEITAHPTLAAWAREASQRLAGALPDTLCAAACAHHLLELADTLSLAVRERVWLVEAAWPEVSRQGLWATWRPLLEKQLAVSRTASVPAHTSLLLRRLGVACRWLGHYGTAEDYLREAIHHTTESDDLSGQANALIELAVVLRHQQRDKDAQAIARQARAGFARVGDAEGEERCLLELAQQALDQNRPEAALQQLEAATLSARAAALQCDAHLQLGNLQRALDCAEQAVTLVARDRPNLARAQATLGRVYLVLGRLSEAEDHLSLALLLLDQGHDMLGWARAASALARVRWLQDQADEALSLLEDAGAQQRFLMDLAGLFVTLQGILSVHVSLIQSALEAGDEERATELTQAMREYDDEWQAVADRLPQREHGDTVWSGQADQSLVERR